MVARRSGTMLFALLLGFCSAVTSAQQVSYEERDGVKYQVTRQVVTETVPTTVMQDRQQTVYTQQVTTQNLTHQQNYVVPVTQYQMVSTLRGRWNPFVTPYWTYNLEPVTTWHNTVANVQIPVSQVTWVPQSQTVQVPVTEYRTAEKEIITRVALGGGGNNSQVLASTSSPPATTSYPTATIAARPTVTSSVPIGGTMLDKDPPRQPTSAWSNDGRYR